MNKLLKLQHHKHTGKILHHRHTSYRALFLIVAMVGVVMALTSQAAKADSYEVTATVPAPMPSGSPIIGNPHTGTIVHTPQITVEGTCPLIVPAVVIALYNNSVLAGSQPCSAQGTFRIPIPLSEGIHSLVATIITITGQAGGSSQPVIITYVRVDNPRQQGTIASPLVANGQAGSVPLGIISDNALIIFGPNSDAVWRGSFIGGTLPYKVKITWGDGNVQEISGVGKEKQVIHHQYPHFTTYQVKIQVTDANGFTVTQYLTAITFASSIILGNISFPQSTFNQASWVTITLYSLYIVLFIMLLILWHKEHLRHLQLARSAVSKRKQRAKR